MQNVRSGWLAAAGPTSTGEAAAGPRPLWTQMIRWPRARTWSQNALPMSSSSRHGGPSCVYAFHAAISNSAAVAAIASSAAGSAPIVGVA